MLANPVFLYDLTQSTCDSTINTVDDLAAYMDEPPAKQSNAALWININANQLKGQLDKTISQLQFLTARQRDLLSGTCDKSKLNRFSDGVVVYLKYFIINSSEEKETPHVDNYVSFRLLITQSIVISITEWQGEPESDFIPVADLFDELQSIVVEDNQNVEIGDWLVTLFKSLADRFSQDINSLHNGILDVENKLLENLLTDRAELILIRKQLTLIRRFLAPIKELLFRLSTEKFNWLQGDHHRHLHEQSEALRRELEEVDLCISRTAIVSEELNNLLADSMNKRIYVMSIVTVVFMPATLVTGLFGINLGGIPGAESVIAFTIFTTLLVALLFLIIIVLKKKKWF